MIENKTQSCGGTMSIPAKCVSKPDLTKKKIKAAYGADNKKKLAPTQTKMTPAPRKTKEDGTSTYIL
jgi:hypothetical protein